MLKDLWWSFTCWYCYLGLVQKAKKAKDKLLKRDGDERTESSYESFYYGGVDPYMWEPQELGELVVWNAALTYSSVRFCKSVYHLSCCLWLVVDHNLYNNWQQCGVAVSTVALLLQSRGFDSLLIIFVSPGATRSHLEHFKKHRAARIDHYVIEVNKRIIRLEKVNVWYFCCVWTVKA